MSDITICVNDDCPERKDCYRHNAKPNSLRQSYADFSESCNKETGYKYKKSE